MQLPLEEITQFILSKTLRNGQLFGDRLPTSTVEGKYNFTDDGFWVGGFWVGLNFLCYELSGDKRYTDIARSSRYRFVKRLYDCPETLDHDIGFLYSPSFVADFKITGDPEARKIALDASRQLASRYNPAGRFIRAWNVWEPEDAFSEENRGRIIVDSLYNLPILYWAAQETGITEYRQIANGHAQTCAKTLVRPDYSTYHTFVFDPDTGNPRFGRTFQGYSDESCWSRGQAWAIGGYAFAYRYTGESLYLNIARKCAKVFIDNLEKDYVPMWDFRLPSKSGEFKDTSAAAVAAASLLELSKYVTIVEAADYTDAAEKMILSLYDNYSTKGNEAAEGLLTQACGHRPANENLNCSLIYGDYYFAEAVAKLKDKTVVHW